MHDVTEEERRRRIEELRAKKRETDERLRVRLAEADRVIAQLDRLLERLAIAGYR